MLLLLLLLLKQLLYSQLLDERRLITRRRRVARLVQYYQSLRLRDVVNLLDADASSCRSRITDLLLRLLVDDCCRLIDGDCSALTL